MNKATLAALAFACAVSAQDSVLNLFLLGFTSQSIVGSIITSVSFAGGKGHVFADTQIRTQQPRHTRSIVETQIIAEDWLAFQRQG
jgi:hypothetical protein